jgi:DNA-binding transcriptional MocR family regulator
VVVSASSFTKILAPGLRLGWLECDPSLATAIANRGYVVSGGCVAPFTAGVVAQAILSGDAAAWLTKLRRDYRESSAALARAVEAEARTMRRVLHTGPHRRPRSRGARRSLRTFPGASLRQAGPPVSIPALDAFQLRF